MQTTPSANGDRKEDGGHGRKLGEREALGQRRRRRRRGAGFASSSNSLGNDDDAGQEEHEQNSASSADDGPALRRVNRAEESSNAQNVTSARSATTGVAAITEPQPNPRGGAQLGPAGQQAAEAGPAEAAAGSGGGGGEDKNRRNAGQLERPAGASTFSSQRQAAAVRFCDFDLHMALGYAFVADSTGRIHRFKLPTASSSSATASLPPNTRARARVQTLAGGEKATSEQELAENDQMNNIGAGPSFDLASFRQQLEMKSKMASNSSGDTLANNIIAPSLDYRSSLESGGDDDDDTEHSVGPPPRYTNKVSAQSGSSSYNDSTLQQSAQTGHGQHPAVSGSVGAHRLHAASADDAPTSGDTSSLSSAGAQHENVSVIV